MESWYEVYSGAGYEAVYLVTDSQQQGDPDPISAEFVFITLQSPEMIETMIDLIVGYDGDLDRMYKWAADYAIGAAMDEADTWNCYEPY